MNTKFFKFKLLIIAAIMLSASLFPIAPAQASVLYVGVAKQVVYLGESFMVEWYLDTQGQDVNSFSIAVTYSTDKLEVIETSVGNSAIDLWVKTPEVDRDNGRISMVGGITGGVSNNKLPLFRTVFKPFAVGPAKLSMFNESDVLISDGLGSSAGIIFNEVTFTVNPADLKPANISSPTHPNPDDWYQEKDVEINVSKKSGEEYSYSFSSNIEMMPDQEVDQIDGPIRLHNLPDGIYYFKLNSKQEPSNWQEAGVYTVRIDTTPPKEFRPAVAKDEGIFDGQSFVSFNTIDDVSGVDYYEVKTSLGGWTRTEDTFFKLPGIVLGDTVEVKVIDMAGNERIETVQINRTFASSVLMNPLIWGIIILVLIAAAGVKFFRRKLKKYKVDDF